MGRGRRAPCRRVALLEASQEEERLVRDRDGEAGAVQRVGLHDDDDSQWAKHTRWVGHGAGDAR